MTLNHEIFVRDPLTWTIPNDGVAKLLRPETPQEWDVLRHELTSFVCDGEYRRGMERILDSYLRGLSQPTQPSVWVSGFYGSGKSHFLRVLEYLWRDLVIPDTGGKTARNLANLPSDVRAQLTELSTNGARKGGLWSAAGTLGAGAGFSVRLGILGIVFRAAGLPDQYPAARLVLRLRRTPGLYEQVRAGVERRGADWESELVDMYVSTALVESWLEAEPGLAADAEGVWDRIEAQFRPVDDISQEEFLRTLRDVLALVSTTPGEIPCTLLVLDELQQYIGSDIRRVMQVQEVVQSLTSELGSRVLLVAAGQAQLNETPELQRLQDRYTVRVILGDADVEKVVRTVVLLKKQESKPELNAVLEQSRGEIARHLAGTRIGHRAEDTPDLLPDYPLLPVRRRFWELVLRTLDSGGTVGQLRTQLRVVHDANRGVGGRPLGSVVGGDVLYGQLRLSMLRSAVLSQEVDGRIQALDDGSEDGSLRQRLCAIILLIDKLPPDVRAAEGLHTDPESLADLLVEDLAAGSATLRQRLPLLLDGLVSRGTLMLVEGQYHLQSRVAAEWELEYRRLLATVRQDGRVPAALSDELEKAARQALRGLTLTDGAVREPRSLRLHFGGTAPQQQSEIIAWVRDGWDAVESDVLAAAREAGTDGPIVYVFLPRRDNEALRDSLASYLAASECIETTSPPSTPEGEEARNAMLSRRDLERRRLDGLLAGVLANGRVYQGGGVEVMAEGLSAAMLEAARASLRRLFTRFSLADHSGWSRVVDTTLRGDGDVLGAVDWAGDPEANPVCREVLEYAGAAGRRGRDVRNHFSAPPYGWPKDAVDGALLAMTAAGQLRAADGARPVAVRELTRPVIGNVTFVREGVVVGARQKIALRTLLTELGITCAPGEEAVKAPVALQALRQLAASAGGDPPRPAPPDTELLSEIGMLAGNAQLAAMYERREELKQLHTEWVAQRDRIAARLPRWELTRTLIDAASGLPGADGASVRAGAVASQRALLDDPDPVTPLLEETSELLRTALRAAKQRHDETLTALTAALDASPDWCSLAETRRTTLLARTGIAPSPSVDAADDAALLQLLRQTPLREWETLADALPERFNRLRDAVVREVTPAAVTVRAPHQTLHTAADLDGYLARLRSMVLAEIDAGRPVTISA